MITLKEISKLEGAKEGFGKTFDSNLKLSFSTDSRNLNEGEAFLAIDGERFKPMRFLEKLEGCPLVIYTDNDENRSIALENKESFYFLPVVDSIKFLQNIASFFAEKFVENGGKLIAISGSNGKTTTKEMLFHLLEAIEPETVCTQKNNNNHIGVPLSLLQIKESTKFCVLELGSNHPGEIKVLCDIAKPNVGVTTNIGDTHLEFFKNRKNVFKEEGYLFHALEKSEDPKKLFFINKDDPFLSSIKPNDFSRTYGADSGNDIQIKRSFDHALITGALLEEAPSKALKIENSHITGEHNFLNLALAFSIAKELTCAEEKSLLAAAKNFRPTSNRSEWLSIGDSKIFLDAYNANPTSMKAAIKGFLDSCSSEGFKAEDLGLVLGDMNELGEDAAVFHRELGVFCKNLGLVNMFFIGRYANDYNAGFGGTGEEFPSAEEFGAKRKERFLAYKRSFIKGSRSLQLESIPDIK